jgi:threonine synthase
MRSFTSTRGSDSAGLREALMRGLASDGGLYVPEEIGRLPDFPSALATESPVAVAQWAAPALFPEVAPESLRRVVEEALTFPIPLVPVEPDIHVLELFHGPTYAFKDVGARFLARLLVVLDGGDRMRTVLVATSGDTGGAVADAFHGLDAFRVLALFPRDGISSRQRRQMTTLGGNVTALAVDGTFDDCQRLAKEAFLDLDMRERWSLMSANSINVGRLLPQCLYYVYAAAKLGWREPSARFVVPSGNLGNLCAGLIAKRMGMPSTGFIAASNVNRGFVEFLETGCFEARPVIATASSAMDVGEPSNLERILWFCDGDLTGLRRDIVGHSVTDEQARRCMADVYHRTGYVLDPHTAVAFEAAQRHHRGSGEPTIVLATAHPAKFPDFVQAVIGREPALPRGLVRAMEAEEQMMEAPPSLAALRQVLEEVAA